MGVTCEIVDAIEALDLERVTALCLRQPQLVMSPCDGVFPIHVASKYGDLGIVRFLVDRGADVNVLDQWGDSALWYATDAREVKVVQELVQRGADVNFYSIRSKESVLGLASVLAFSDEGATIANLLLAAGARMGVGHALELGRIGEAREMLSRKLVPRGSEKQSEKLLAATICAIHNQIARGTRNYIERGLTADDERNVYFEARRQLDDFVETAFAQPLDWGSPESADYYFYTLASALRLPDPEIAGRMLRVCESCGVPTLDPRKMSPEQQYSLMGQAKSSPFPFEMIALLKGFGVQDVRFPVMPPPKGNSQR